MVRLGILAVLAIAAAGPLCAAVMAAEATDAAEAARSLDARLAQVAEHYRAGDLAEAKQTLATAKNEMAQLSAAGAADGLVDEFRSRYGAASRLVARLEKMPASTGAGSMSAATPTPASGPASPDDVSFVRQVAPILVAKCSGCHIAKSEGDFSVATYEAFARGSSAGVVYTAGESRGSRLMDLLETGDMPRGGGTVSASEQKLIAEWIDQGARFDGPDPSVELASLTPGAAVPRTPAMTARTPAANEPVEFVRDLAPILAAQCMECHGGARPAAQLRLDRFDGLLAGGGRGRAVAPGKPAESLLVAKLKGTADGQRMPLNRDPLSDEQIALFERWIRAGARYDGADPAEDLQRAWQRLAADAMSPEELSQRRDELARANWRAALPDVAFETLATARFQLVGSLGAARLAEIAELADALDAKIVKQLALDRSGAPLRGKLTLFLFDSRVDYAEFGRMTDRRTVPEGISGHARYDGLDAYACVAVPTEDPDLLSLLVAEQIAAAYLERFADAPAWFRGGTARQIAVRVNPRNRSAQAWDQQLAQAIAGGVNLGRLLEANQLDARTAALGYGVVGQMMTAAPKFRRLLDALGDGRSFNQALANAYQATAPQLVEQWAAAAAGR